MNPFRALGNVVYSILPVTKEERQLIDRHIKTYTPEVIGKFSDDIDVVRSGRREPYVEPSGMSVWSVYGYTKTYEGDLNRLVEGLGGAVTLDEARAVRAYAKDKKARRKSEAKLELLAEPQ